MNHMEHPSPDCPQHVPVYQSHDRRLDVINIQKLGQPGSCDRPAARDMRELDWLLATQD